MQYVTFSSRPSNIHNLIDGLINVTSVFCYDHQSSMRSNNNDTIRIHDGQEKPQHRLLHHDCKGTQHNCWATLHVHDEPHDRVDGKNVGGVEHRSLALVLDDTDYRRLTRDQSATTNHLVPPTETVGTINFTHPPPQFEIMTFQEDQKNLHKAYKIQEAVTDIGVERIVASVNEQYLEDLNEDYFG